MSTVSRLIHGYQKATGRLHEIDSSKLRVQPVKNEDGQSWHRYTPEHDVKAGWYMLEVRGTTSVLGHDFRVRIKGDMHHLLLGSKSISKRILFIPELVSQLEFSIQSRRQHDLGVEFSLSKLSPSFALSRMRKKIHYSTGAPVACDEINAVFTKYVKLMQRHVFKVAYTDWRDDREGGATTFVSSQSNIVAFNPSKSPTLVIVAMEPTTDARHILAAMESLSPMVRSQVSFVTGSADCSEQIVSMLSPERYFRLDHMDCIEQQQTIAASEADYVLLIGDDVELAPTALSNFLACVQSRPDVELVYSDHEQVKCNGETIVPVFKPEWNPELLLSGNYVGRCVLVRKQLIERIGGLQPAMGDSLVYKLLLDSVRLADPALITRIPELLFSCKDANELNAGYFSVGKRDVPALESHLAQSDSDAVVEPGLIDNALSVKRSIKLNDKKTAPSVDIIIPTRDNVDILRCCISSIQLLTDYPNFRITVVDNDSSDPATFEYYTELEEEPRFHRVSYAGPFNYSAINNFAVSKTNGDIVVLLNNDTEVCHRSWLTEMVGQAMRPEVGCVGAKLYYSNNLIQHAGVIVGLNGVAGHAHRYFDRNDDGYCGRLKLSHNVSAVTAACLAVKRNVFTEVSGLDAINLKVAYNDVDFCLRVLEAGYQNIWTPFAELYHHESVSRGADDTPAKAKRFQREYEYMLSRWNTNTMIDPAYNPNLAIDLEDFSLAA